MSPLWRFLSYYNYFSKLNSQLKLPMTHKWQRDIWKYWFHSILLEKCFHQPAYNVTSNHCAYRHLARGVSITNFLRANSASVRFSSPLFYYPSPCPCPCQKLFYCLVISSIIWAVPPLHGLHFACSLNISANYWPTFAEEFYRQQEVKQSQPAPNQTCKQCLTMEST